MTGRLAALIGMCVLGTHGTAAAEGASQPYPAMHPRVAAGEIVGTEADHPDTGVDWGRAVGIVNAPIEQVLEIVSDYGNYDQFMPHFKKSKVLSQRGRRALIYVEAEVAKGTLTVWAQMKMRPITLDGGRMVIEGRMTKGNLSRMEARWELTPLSGNRTLVTFKLLVDPKVPLPDSLITWENVKASRRGIKALRKQLTRRFASGMECSLRYGSRGIPPARLGTARLVDVRQARC